MPSDRRQGEARPFVLSDPEGVFLTLSVREAEAILAELEQDEYEDLSENMRALRVQLQEWFDA